MGYTGLERPFLQRRRVILGLLVLLLVPIAAIPWFRTSVRPSPPPSRPVTARSHPSRRPLQRVQASRPVAHQRRVPSDEDRDPRVDAGSNKVVEMTVTCRELINLEEIGIPDELIAELYESQFDAAATEMDVRCLDGHPNLSALVSDRLAATPDTGLVAR